MLYFLCVIAMVWQNFLEVIGLQIWKQVKNNKHTILFKLNCVIYVKHTAYLDIIKLALLVMANKSSDSLSSSSHWYSLPTTLVYEWTFPLWFRCSCLHRRCRLRLQYHHSRIWCLLHQLVPLEIMDRVVSSDLNLRIQVLDRDSALSRHHSWPHG